MTPAERKLIAQIAVQTSWANTPNRTARTAAAREGFDARFVRLALEKHPGLTGEALAKCAEALRKAHFARLSLKSAQARAAKKTS